MAQPLSLATAVGLFFDLLPTVYADEKNFDGRSAPTDRTTTATSNPNSSSSTTNWQRRRGTVLAPEEELMPGLVYVALAGMTGSFIVRQKGLLLKTLSPVAFASAAGYYFLPHTTRNLLGVNQTSYDKLATPYSHSHPHSTYPHSDLSRTDLVTQARGAWNTAETKLDELEDKLSDNIEDETQEVKHQWNTNTAKVEDSKENLKNQLHQTKSWVENKAHEADKALDSAQTKVVDAVEDAKDWVQDKAKLVDRDLESTAKDASSWRTSQKVSSPSVFSTSSSGANGDKQADNKTGTEKTWFHHKSEPAPEETHSHRSKWWSSRTKSTGSTAAEFGGADSGAHDHWSDGEEQGTAKVRDSDNGFWFPRLSGRYGASDGLLDNKDVDRWSSTGEEIGTAKMDESPYAHKHRRSFLGSAPVGKLPREPEYWSNGEEISSADIRDANYYKYAGSFKSGSLGRTSWWDKRSWGTSSDTKDTMSSLKGRAESLVQETKEAAERAGLNLSNNLAEAKKRAETAARQAEATGDTFLRERQLSMERTAWELEQRLAAEKKAADRAAADAKARAHAWELEQLTLADKEVQDRVAREKATAEAKAAQIKAKAEAWALEQKENADMAAKKIHERFLHETAAAEKAAREAKAALEAKLREEKIKLERNARELEERIRIEKAKEDKADAELRAQAAAYTREQKVELEKAEVDAREAKSRAESVLLEKKRAAEHAAKEMADLVAHESAAKIERETRLRAQMDDLKKEKQETSHAGPGSGSGWGWPWSSKSDSNTVYETTSASTTHTRKGYDSTEHLVDHIIEDIKQTKEDIEGGVGHLKDTVLGAGAQATNAGRQSGEAARGAMNGTVEGRGTWTYGSTATVGGINVKASDFGQGVDGVAAKAERDVKFKAEVNGDDKSETARKAYDNVVDAATSLDGQLQHRHHHHEHSREFPVRRQNGNDHHLSDHIRDDLRQTKEDIQRGMEYLKETVYSAEQTADKASSEGKSWLNTKTRQAEEKTSRLESELRTGLDKAGDKIRGMDGGLDETLNPAGREAAEDFWFHAEEDRQRQQQRRGSGRAM
ncbi:hypothetical protein BG011_000191 [Mortierella polycephala]|uniref:MICOS complex subunit n=1 Tax=Mortierella polycephala TaxID=41804 RepID=A0A9P6PJH3_9FUNG|nr:hypothetical protein BG011_000191 [Mortierella polycephala]